MRFLAGGSLVLPRKLPGQFSSGIISSCFTVCCICSARQHSRLLRPDWGQIMVVLVVKQRCQNLRLSVWCHCIQERCDQVARQLHQGISRGGMWRALCSWGGQVLWCMFKAFSLFSVNMTPTNHSFKQWAYFTCAFIEKYRSWNEGIGWSDEHNPFHSTQVNKAPRIRNRWCWAST